MQNTHIVAVNLIMKQQGIAFILKLNNGGIVSVKLKCLEFWLK